MHLAPTTRGHAEVYDHRACPTCSADWTPGRGGYRAGYHHCACANTPGHRTLTCKVCDTRVYEPDHHIQDGPTADYR